MTQPADPWTGMNPNSGNQRWSRWRFRIEANPAKRPRQVEVIDNARRFFRALFGTTTGQVRVVTAGLTYVVELRVEGPPAHDPDCRASVQRLFERDFVGKGFGAGAVLKDMDVALVAGSKQDGSPAEQLIVLPPLPLPKRPGGWARGWRLGLRRKT